MECQGETQRNRGWEVEKMGRGATTKLGVNAVKLMTPNTGSTVRPVIVASFGPPALACIRSWGEQGFPVGMICIQSKKEIRPASKYLTDYASLAPGELYTESGIGTISKFLKRFRASGIICISETIASWLNNYRSTLLGDVACWFPESSIIKNVLSKERQIEAAQHIGFNILPTYKIYKDLESASKILPKHFPLCLRPSDPGTVKPIFKVHLVSSSAELKNFIESFHKIEKPIIAQPFMNLPNLVVHGARTVTGSTIGFQSFLVERKFEGVTLTIRPTELDDDLRDKCIAFTDYFNVTGNYHFEFLVDPATGSTYFLELNNRLGGTTAKVYACGYDEPLLALQAYGIKGSNKKKVRNVVVSSKQALLKYLFYTLKDRLTPLDYPSESNAERMAKAIYGVFRYKDDVLLLRDVRGSLALYLGNIRQRLGG